MNTYLINIDKVSMNFVDNFLEKEKNSNIIFLSSKSVKLNKKYLYKFYLIKKTSLDYYIFDKIYCIEKNKEYSYEN